MSTCPALHILRGTLSGGREPRHMPRDDQPTVCRHCNCTIPRRAR